MLTSIRSPVGAGARSKAGFRFLKPAVDQHPDFINIDSSFEGLIIIGF